MNLKKLSPWNWFKNEEDTNHNVPVRHSEKGRLYPEHQLAPMLQLHRDLDRYFDQIFRGFNLPAWGGPFMPIEDSDLLRPKVDLSSTEQEYVLTVEIPGVNENEVSVDISGNALTIKGEKKQEKEEKEKDYYRIERRYGSFQRVLSLPEDVDQDGIKAGFKNGVLTLTMPRKALPQGESRQVKITAGD